MSEPAPRPNIRQRIRALNWKERQLGETASRLAGGLPIIEVRFDRHGEFTVHGK